MKHLTLATFLLLVLFLFVSCKEQDQTAKNNNITKRPEQKEEAVPQKIKQKNDVEVLGLITMAQIEKIIGAKMVGKKYNNKTGYLDVVRSELTINFQKNIDINLSKKRLTIKVRQAKIKKMTSGLYDGLVDIGGKSIPVKGLGERAAFNPKSRNTISGMGLIIESGVWMIHIQYRSPGMGNEDMKKICTEIAKIILEKLE